MDPDSTVDLMVIGGGSGGVRAARRAAQLGAHVALAEQHLLGGTCVNVGCIPKKLLSNAAHFHEDFVDAAGYGWSVGAATFDWAALIAAKDREIAQLNAIYQDLLEGSGVVLHRGRATLEDARTVRIGSRRVRAAHILVATGGAPVRPPIPGAHLAMVSDDAFHMPALPQRMLVYGAGYIAVEFASIFNGLGTRTSMVYRGARLLKEFDADLGAHLAAAMSARGVHLIPSTTITRIVPLAAAEDGPGPLRVEFDSGAAAEVDGVLLATGRLPNVRDLGLERCGVALSPAGAIQVDANFQSSVATIHAVGDVTARVLLTPVALAEGEAVAERLFGGTGRGVNTTLVPTAVFSHPAVGTVGWSESAARAAGRRVRVYRSVFTPLRHTLARRTEKTLMKLVVEEETDRVLGLHMVGPDAGEIVQGFAVALNCGATKAQFDATLAIHPTVAEEFVTMRIWKAP